MKQDQQDLMQLPKVKYHVIKLFIVLMLTSISLLFSCKPPNDLRAKSHIVPEQIINNLLEYYVKKYDSVYLSHKIVNLENSEVLFKNMDIKKGSINNCIDVTKDSIGMDDYPLIVNDYSQMINDTLFLSKIWNPKVYKLKDLTIKNLENLNSFKIEENDLKSGKKKLNYNLQDEIAHTKYFYWNIEHDIPVLLLSKPIILDNYKLSAVYVSRIKEGDFLWFLKKEKKKWVVFCEKRLNYH